MSLLLFLFVFIPCSNVVFSDRCSVFWFGVAGKYALLYLGSNGGSAVSKQFYYASKSIVVFLILVCCRRHRPRVVVVRLRCRSHCAPHEGNESSPQWWGGGKQRPEEPYYVDLLPVDSHYVFL